MRAHIDPRWLCVALCAACYQPEGPTACTVSCADGPCPAGFACGGDGLCHADGEPACHTGLRKPIAVNPPTGIALTDFPIAVIVTNDAELARAAKSDASDLIFADAHGSTLATEIESYDPVTGGLVAWVRVPVLAGPTPLFVYYGGATMQVPRDINHQLGWDYDPASMELTFYGTYCTELKTGSLNNLVVSYGCPLVP